MTIEKTFWNFSMVVVFLSVVLSLVCLTTAMDPAYVHHYCSNTKNFTGNSTYRPNLGDLLSTLGSKPAIRNGFHNVTSGEEPNKVYGLFLCRGDVGVEICQNCINLAISNVTQRCPVQKEAVIWYDLCLLRYSNESFFSTMDESPAHWMCSKQDITPADQFDLQVRNLINEAANQSLNTPKMFAAIKKDFIEFYTVYSLVQCTQDLSRGDCSRCLRQAISKLFQFPAGCGGRAGGRMLYPSCNIRYEQYPFYTPILTAAPAPTPRSKGRKGMKAASIAIGTTASAITVVGLSCSFVRYKWRRNKEKRAIGRVVKLLRSPKDKIADGYSKYILERQKQGESPEFPIFPLALTLEATQHFSCENKLGEGGFGPVYKGVLAHGTEIAVKSPSRTSGQGLQEFKNEVTLIAKLQHKNLVRLLGCCLEGNELLLIYEYVPNKSLDFHLFDSTRGVQLDWERRISISIINGIARGLLYLHEDSRLKVIHRDLKTSNVLLDHEMNPKILDFGMARIFGGNENEANTNRIVGTHGYMAPEYAMEGLLSVKSDVFSFGVLLLETWKLWCEGEALELMDPVLEQSCVTAELLKCIHIGLLCVQEDPADRPTMSSVVVMLASDTVTLPQPTQPAFSIGRIIAKSDQSSSDPKFCSVNQITLSNVSPR